jgi:hypothetical protein
VIALLLAAALAAAPGCPAALARAATLSDPDLAREAAPLVEQLERDGSGGPVLALRDQARWTGLAGPLDQPVAAARFRAALARHCALAAQAALPAPDPGDRARAQEILDRPGFRRARADPEALRRWLLALWQRVLDLVEIDEVQRYATFSRAVFLTAAAVAVLFGVVALGRRRGALRPPAREGPIEARPAPDSRLDAAEEAAAAGEAVQAVRLALLAALSALERQGAVPPGRALTNQELVGQLRRADPARVAALRTLSRLFDRAVYGGLPAGAAEAAAALQAARTLGAGGRQ